MKKSLLRRMVTFVLFIIFGLAAMATGALLRNVPQWTAAPGFGARLVTYVTTNTAELSVNSEFPELQSPLLPMSAPQADEAIVAVAERLGWQVIENKLPEGSIHFVVASPMFGFRDDIVMNLLKWNEGYLLLAYSRSRLGRADFAANASHLVKFKQALALELRAKGLAFSEVDAQLGQ